MDVKIKALLVLLPFAVSGYAGFSLLQPLMDEVKTKDAAISDKENEAKTVAGKVQGGKKLSLQAQQLKQDIDRLRDSVPKAPDTDLLTIDLEKMCKDAGMNMIGLVPPKADSGHPKPAEDPNKAKNKLANLIKGGTAGAAAGSGAQAPGKLPSELETSTKSFIVSGDFLGLQKLVHELETYQRVVRIDELSFHLPRKQPAKEKVKIDESAPGEGDDSGDPRLLFITMTLTTYFLP